MKSIANIHIDGMREQVGKGKILAAYGAKYIDRTVLSQQVEVASSHQMASSGAETPFRLNPKNRICFGEELQQTVDIPRSERIYQVDIKSLDRCAVQYRCQPSNDDELNLPLAKVLKSGEQPSLWHCVGESPECR